ncbi:MAG TPA: 3-methyl-2-oxobutanoate hydroxymethyltransferase [Oceanospirillales bacterium]|nr:3-methyl-2-oxobutanoate hydroxymethyltransferase [Oceanospirillales bacterium]
MNINQLMQLKKDKQKISMLTCYDYTSAKIINQSNVDMILVGDSAAMVMHGHNSTLPIAIQTMALHVQAVVKGAPDKFIVADLPFISYRKSLTENMNAVELLMKAGAHAVKLEGCDGNEELIQHIVNSGVPVMGHLGLTPQSVNALGGYKVQGKKDKAKEKIRQDAKKLQEAGCFSLVLECVPSSLAKIIAQELAIITIGIGAGNDTDGQVLVMQDMLGLQTAFKPKFVRQYLNAEQLFIQAFNAFDKDVKSAKFPSQSESYS